MKFTDRLLDAADHTEGLDDDVIMREASGIIEELENALRVVESSKLLHPNGTPSRAVSFALAKLEKLNRE